MEQNSILIEKAQAGEKEAREVLIEQNLGLVPSVKYVPKVHRLTSSLFILLR